MKLRDILNMLTEIDCEDYEVFVTVDESISAVKRDKFLSFIDDEKKEVILCFHKDIIKNYSLYACHKEEDIASIEICSQNAQV